MFVNIYPSVKYIFMSFAYILIGLFPFLLLSFDEFFMCSRYDSLGRNMCFSLSSHSATGSFIEQRT